MQGFVKTCCLALTAIVTTTAFVPAHAVGEPTVGELVAGAKAHAVCSTLTLKGSYSFFQQGTIVGIGPAADVGVFQVDGQGHLTGSETVHVNGLVFHDTFTNGTYQVNKDCTGTATWTAVFQDNRPPQPSFVIANHAKIIHLLSTAPGAVLVGTAHRQ